MRRILVSLILLGGVVFIIGRMAELQAIADTIRRANVWIISLAIGVQLAWLLNVAASYQAIFQGLGMDERFGRLLLLAAAAYFVNVVAPSAGIGGAAVFVSEAQRRGYSPARALLATVLNLLFDYAGFLCVLALGMAVLIRRDRLATPELVATGILVAIALALIFALYLGMRSASTLGSALAWISRQINRLAWLPFLRPNLPEHRAHGFALDVADGLRLLRRDPKKLLLPAALAISNKAMLVSILFLMFLAFRVPFSPGTLIAAFSIAYLFFIVSPTPSGIGFVEGALTLALSSMQVPLSAAAVITLAYRGITLWIPLAVGMLAFRTLGQPQKIGAEA